ncbi:hypothetical protein H0R92_09930 [Treponema sp. OMZ 840]|uniref:hypothetical protein n=1 Tax=Treponema sp. OMZ 840 TaxID=244313 RepID=UPI003D8BC9B3
MMFKKNKVFTLGAMLLILPFAAVFAYNPPPGGELLYSFTSPFMLSAELSTAGGPLFHVHPGHTALNPALSAGEQRVVVDAAYTALIAPGRNKNYGQAFNLGALVPSRYGVFTGVAQGVFVPFNDMLLKNSFTLRASYSKDIADWLYIGAGLYGGFGSDWSLGADIGFLYLPEKIKALPFIGKPRIAFALTGMGKNYKPATVGINGLSEHTTSFPSFFTPHIGFAGNLFEIKNFSGGFSMDVSLPAFQNFVFDTGLQFLFAETVRLSTGWQFNLRETIAKTASWYPSVSLSVKFGFSAKEASLLGKKGWQQSEMIVSGAYRPMKKNIHAVSGGAALYLGLKDTAAPEIILWGNNE